MTTHLIADLVLLPVGVVALLVGVVGLVFTVLLFTVLIVADHRRFVVMVRADEVRPGDRLASGGHMGVRLGGETVLDVTPDELGGEPIVYVTSRQHTRWSWTLGVGELVPIYDRPEATS
jgi:hypothetical protein